nr:tetratricopeptide repeat protein [Pararhodobacter sp. SW119]
MFALMRRYGWIVIVAVIGIVGFAAWNEWSKSQAEARAQALGDSVVAALETPAPAERRSLLEALASTQSGSNASERAAVLNLLLAADAMERGETDAALPALQRVADDSALPQSYRQLAALKRTILGGDQIPRDEREATLTGLAAPGQVFRPLALEQLALLELEAGNRASARAQLEALLSEPDLTADLRRRVTQLIVVLGGEVESDLG